MGLVGYSVRNTKPPHRPFSLQDLSISYPLVEETVTSVNGELISLPGAAIVVFLVVLLFVPGLRTSRHLSKKRLIRLKLWELERGLAGLCLSVTQAFFTTQCVKNMVGRPRPNFLAQCVPDTTAVAEHLVSTYGSSIEERSNLVDSGICTATDGLDDAYRSFPSGHASFAWAGMLYLSLFLCAKLAIWVPHLPAGALENSETASDDATELLPTYEAAPVENEPKGHKIPIRNLAASPPGYLIVVALIPIAVAVWICTTRYKDFFHFGSDIVAGSLIGILTAILAFRWYHLPLGRGQGWAWGPRSPACAFGVAVGTGSYVD